MTALRLLMWGNCNTGRAKRVLPAPGQTREAHNGQSLCTTAPRRCSNSGYTTSAAPAATAAFPCQIVGLQTTNHTFASLKALTALLNLQEESAAAAADCCCCLTTAPAVDQGAYMLCLKAILHNWKLLRCISMLRLDLNR